MSWVVESISPITFWPPGWLEWYNVVPKSTNSNLLENIIDVEGGLVKAQSYFNKNGALLFIIFEKWSIIILRWCATFRVIFHTDGTILYVWSFDMTTSWCASSWIMTQKHSHNARTKNFEDKIKKKAQQQETIIRRRYYTNYFYYLIVLYLLIITREHIEIIILIEIQRSE